MNIEFEYLYRDAGNFKNWKEIIFSNPSNVTIETLTQCARRVLIDESYFVAKKADIPDLHSSKYDTDLDHGWHEFSSFSATSEPPNDQQGRTIEDFLTALIVASEI